MADRNASRREAGIFHNKFATVKDVDAAKGIVKASWSHFGNLDSDGDVIMLGAYAKTIEEWGPAGRKRIKMLWQHDYWEMPLGIPIELYEDTEDLIAVQKISIGTQRGRDIMVLYQDGVITEHSVRLDRIKRDEDDFRRIIETRLWEGSPVTWGANMLTPTLEVKGASDAGVMLRHIAGQMARMNKALKSGISDELGYQIEKTLGDWHEQLQAVLKGWGPGGPEPEQGEEYTDLITAIDATNKVFDRYPVGAGEPPHEEAGDATFSDRLKSILDLV